MKKLSDNPTLQKKWKIQTELKKSKKEQIVFTSYQVDFVKWCKRAETSK